MSESTLEQISKQLVVLTQLVALRLCDGKTRQSQVELLAKAGMQPKAIAELLGTSANSVSVALYQMKKAKSGRAKSQPADAGGTDSDSNV